MDLSGKVVGVVVAKLSALKFALVTGDVPQNVNFAINGWVIKAFLDAHGIDYEVGQPRPRLDPADVAEEAHAYTVVVECWK